MFVKTFKPLFVLSQKKHTLSAVDYPRKPVMVLWHFVKNYLHLFCPSSLGRLLITQISLEIRFPPGTLVIDHFTQAHRTAGGGQMGDL